MKRLLLVMPFFIFLPLFTQAKVSAEKIIEATNKERQKAHLPPLKVDKRLCQSASLKAKDMAGKHYFSHTSPGGKRFVFWFNVIKFNFLRAAENLAMGKWKKETEVVSGWMRSPGHKRNILDRKCSRIGVAVVEGTVNKKRTTLVVQHFAN